MNPAQAHPHQDYSAADEALFSKISWHLLPLLIVCYVIAFLDRVNIGFAQLQMKQTLPFSDAAYAFGAGVFFIGYFLCEVPSNLLLEKIGARKTLLRIMFCWGIVASCMMFVETTMLFYILRFLLGALEAGFFPGIILYLTYWYPAARRAKVIAIFMTGATIAYLLAGPLCGAILKYMDGWLGHHGWQWLFVTQGLPASFLGIFAFFYLKDKPEQAGWLTSAEKISLRAHLDNDAHAVQTASHGSFWALLRDPKVYIMSLVYFLMLGATYVLVFSTPTLIRSWGIKDVFTVGMLSAVGPLFALVGMVLIGRSSDRYLERRRHFLFCCALAAAGSLIVVVSQGSVAACVAGLAVLTIGQSSATPIFFAALSDYIPKRSAAGGIALISSLGNLGPAVMPSIVIALNTRTGNPVAGLWLVIALWLVSGLILLRSMRPTAAAPSTQLATA
ncbi:D-galactonate transporter [Variovorax boronicumulans]|uniref:D-galactonate transporter n=1 Tax=Variovorax boronicumulans TaxID=436515 RepID=A0AAW8DUU9_9BURK|nr:MFS transporter [Variovorax boronicumulans]MDP9878027.1 D-galactonate transporter [Variovorax boronicumulans]MDP9923310.1 D-galactonate transporter [Variovorax boronicumulans]